MGIQWAANTLFRMPLCPTPQVVVPFRAFTDKWDSATGYTPSHTHAHTLSRIHTRAHVRAHSQTRMYTISHSNIHMHTHTPGLANSGLRPRRAWRTPMCARLLRYPFQPNLDGLLHIRDRSGCLPSPALRIVWLGRRSEPAVGSQHKALFTQCYNYSATKPYPTCPCFHPVLTPSSSSPI